MAPSKEVMDAIGLGVAIHTPLSGVGEPAVSFFGNATLIGHPFTIRGGNECGAWKIVARLDGTADLKHTLESLPGIDGANLQLPHGFPSLTLSDLSFSFDTATGDYEAHGRTAAADLPIGGTTIQNASLDLAIGSKNGSTSVKLESGVVIDGIDARLLVQIAHGSNAIGFSANKYEFFLARSKTDNTSNVLALVRPGANTYFDDVELAWAKSAWTSVPFRTEKNHPAGTTFKALFLLAGTRVGRLLAIDEPLRLKLDQRELRAEIGHAGRAKEVTIPFGGASGSLDEDEANTTGANSSDTTDEDEEEDATDASLTIDGPLSLASVIEQFDPSSDGSSTSSTWRDYVGKCLQLENIGIAPITSPKIGLSLVLDASVHVGPWLSIAFRKASFRLIPDKLPFTDIHVDFGLQSAAIVLDLPPIAKASAAVRYQRDDATATEVITGAGQLELFEKLSIGLLVHFEWQKRLFQGAFGFVFAKGFAVGPPGFQLTGIGGGFGYHRTLMLPTAAEAVAKNPIVQLLHTEPDGDAFGDASRMLTYLRTFMRSLQQRPNAWCIAFGATFQIVEWVDCVALVLAEIRTPGFDLALLGMADFPIGVSSYKLGHVQLALLARWNSKDDSLRFVGTLTPQSWLLHPNCKLRGAFAICLWPAGMFAGDFVVSMGGYSPLVPTRTHYPALDRIGFTWNVSKRLSLFGQLYFALDRYGIQFGGRARLKYTTTVLDADAEFSFDVLSTWMPPFFQAKVRVSIHVQLRAIATLRLGLVVDVYVYGPPFGAELKLEIDIKVWKRTFTIRAGESLETAKKAARPDPRDVLAFAKGGKAMQVNISGKSMESEPDSNRIVSFSASYDDHERQNRFRADNLVLNVAMSIPIKTIYRRERTEANRHPFSGDRIDVRPLGWQDVISDLIWDIQGATDTAEWVVIPELSRPLEALWFIPPAHDASWADSGRRAITGLRLMAPMGCPGDAGLGTLRTQLGSFGMYDHFVPGVKAGSYTLHVESRMKPTLQAAAFHDEVKDIAFVVDAPRFSLVAKEEVRSCSPPHGGNADYQRVLPHIVLDKRALPWERPFDPGASAAHDRAIPWLALVLLTKDEMIADGAVLQDIVAEALTNESVYSPWCDPRNGKLEMAPDEARQMVTVINLSAKLFRSVCPAVAELPLLAHVRRVPLAEKHDNHIGEEGDFAILLCNRIAQPGANVALLVSLEGWRPWLEQVADASDASRVRVVVLHSWNFVSSSGDGSFAAQIKNLDVALLSDRNATTAANDPALESMLKQGYTPIAYQPEGAQRTFAWYRGPLSPADDATFDANRAPFTAADSAVVVDENTGMLDVSLSSAFQIGRLLALGSSSYGRAIRHWNHLKQLDDLANGHAENDRKSLAEEMVAYAASHVIDGEQTGSGFDDVKIVSEWLVTLRLLHPLPFRYLVPAANLLPPESLRLFYVDENWLDALTDGALSLGASSTSANWYLQSNRGTLRKALRQMMARYRRLRRSLPKTRGAEDVKTCGILLRSTLIDRFPGLEVEFLSSEQDPGKLEVLRMEFVGNDILLVLVQGKPASILFKLPREGMTFSYDEEGLRPRITTSTTITLGSRDPNASPIAVDEDWRKSDGATGVLNVRGLADKLEGTDNKSGARFALHWLNGPDDVKIQWQYADETVKP